MERERRENPDDNMVRLLCVFVFETVTYTLRYIPHTCSCTCTHTSHKHMYSHIHLTLM